MAIQEGHRPFTPMVIQTTWRNRCYAYLYPGQISPVQHPQYRVKIIC